MVEPLPVSFTSMVPDHLPSTSAAIKDSAENSESQSTFNMEFLSTWRFQYNASFDDSLYATCNLSFLPLIDNDGADSACEEGGPKGRAQNRRRDDSAAG